MSITSLLKSLRDRIRGLFHTAGCCGACEAYDAAKRTSETLPSMTASEAAVFPGATTINELAKKYNTHRDTIRYRLASSGVTPVAKITSPRVQYIYSTDTFGPLFARFPFMKESKDVVETDVQA